MADDVCYIFQKREFLNSDPTLLGLVSAYIESREENKANIVSYLEISDCSRKVSLDFAVYSPNEKEINELVKKILIFKTIINDWSNALLSEIETVRYLAVQESIDMANRKIDRRKYDDEEYW